LSARRISFGTRQRSKVAMKALTMGGSAARAIFSMPTKERSTSA